MVCKQLKGFEKSDFRGIHVTDENNILITTTGSPALILHTSDFFENIDTVYQDTSKNAFFDAIHFINPKIGFVLGDPKNGLMQLIKTEDGGKTWKDISQKAQLKVEKGEAAFAGSNGNISSVNNRIWLATGGKASHVFHSSNGGKTWIQQKTPIWQGENTTGIFSIYFINKKRGLAVGGNYTQPNTVQNNAIYTTNGGKTWKTAKHQVSGYRSGLVQFSNNTLYSMGINGIDVTHDGGKTWTKSNQNGFHTGTLIKTKNSRIIYYAGDKGTLEQVLYY